MSAHILFWTPGLLVAESQRQVISAKGGNHAPLRGFFCTNGWGKRNLCFSFKAKFSHRPGQQSHTVVCFVSYTVPNAAAQCSSPMQQPAAQLSFSSNHFFSSKAKAEQNWFFCKLTQLGKKARRLISISDGFGIKFHLISSPRQNVSVIFSPWQLYIKMKVNETRIKCPQEGEINLDFWQDLRGLSQNGVV